MTARESNGAAPLSSPVAPDFLELIDTHCHLDIEEFSDHFDMVLKQAQDAGVKKMILPGVDRSGWQRLMHLAATIPGLFAAPGLHPLYLSRHQPHHLEELKELVSRGQVVAIGEIGLDYYHATADRQAQQCLFEQQLQIATHGHLPVLLHVRKAHDQVLATLRRKKFRHGGIVHAFNGSFQQADQYIQMGFGIGVCGTITYERSRRIRRAVAALDQHALVLETDAPDIPVAAHRNEINLPEYLPAILASLAKLRDESLTALASLTTANACRILALPQ